MSFIQEGYNGEHTVQWSVAKVKLLNEVMALTPTGQRPPGQRPTWTESPWTETPLDRDIPHWTETPLDRDTPHWTETPSLIETPLNRDPLVM